MSAGNTDKDSGGRGFLPISLLVGGVQMIITMDITTLGVLLPSINRSFPVSENALGGLFSYSALVFACFMLVGGKVSDMIGYRRSVVLGLLIVGLGAAIATVAPTFELLLLARIFYGLGSALMIPANFAIINTAIPEGRPRQRAYSIFAVVQGAAQFIGPALGGVLAGSLGWRAFFIFNVLLIACLAVGCFLKLPETERTRQYFNVTSAVLFVPSIALMVLALSGGSGLIETVLLRVLMGVFGFGLLVLFLRLQREAAHPLLPPAIWQHSGVKPALFAMMATMAASSALFILPALVMQRALGMSPADAGFGMLPHAVAATCTGQMIGWFMGRYTLRGNVMLGMSVLALGLFVNGWMQPGAGYVLNVMLPMIIGASGSIFSVIMLSAFITGPQAPTEQGVASAVIFTCQQVGISLGAAGILALSDLTDTPLTSYNVGFLAAAAIALSGLTAMALLRRRSMVAVRAPA